MFNTSIKARVYKAISKRIADEEKKYASDCIKLDETARLQKEELAAQAVDRLLGNTQVKNA